jgi:hypothetical protein
MSVRKMRCYTLENGSRETEYISKKTRLIAVNSEDNVIRRDYGVAVPKLYSGQMYSSSRIPVPTTT